MSLNLFFEDTFLWYWVLIPIAPQHTELLLLPQQKQGLYADSGPILMNITGYKMEVPGLSTAANEFSCFLFTLFPLNTVILIIINEFCKKKGRKAVF